MRTLVISARPSRSATTLARALQVRKLATVGNEIHSNLRLLNWGCGGNNFMGRYRTRLGEDYEPLWINNPRCVTVATNKLLTFQRLADDPEIPIPEFTTSSQEANRWYQEDIPVISRRILTGHSGEGIDYYCRPTDDLKDSVIEGLPLYVKYHKKKHEYRVHVVLTSDESYTDVQQKRKRHDTPNDEVDYKVRNHANGWVYCREEIIEPEGIRELSVRVVRQLGLDFGAVDIIWNEHRNQMYVLEVNTAPGLEGQTIDFYVQNLRRLL